MPPTLKSAETFENIFSMSIKWRHARSSKCYQLKWWLFYSTSNQIQTVALQRQYRSVWRNRHTALQSAKNPEAQNASHTTHRQTDGSVGSKKRNTQQNYPRSMESSKETRKIYQKKEEETDFSQVIFIESQTFFLLCFPLGLNDNTHTHTHGRPLAHTRAQCQDKKLNIAQYGPLSAPL